MNNKSRLLTNKSWINNWFISKILNLRNLKRYGKLYTLVFPLKEKQREYTGMETYC